MLLIRGGRSKKKEYERLVRIAASEAGIVQCKAEKVKFCAQNHV